MKNRAKKSLGRGKNGEKRYSNTEKIGGLKIPPRHIPSDVEIQGF